jgi:hypothetical protein
VSFAKPAKGDKPGGKLSPEQMVTFSQAVAEYIFQQRNRYYSRAAPLVFSAVWSRFFPAQDLGRILITGISS